MATRRLTSLLALTLLTAGALAAQAGPAVTVYSEDLAFVRDTRAWDVRSATDTLRVSDLPLRVDPTSIMASPGSGRVTRLAFRSDLASGELALEHARGSRVRIAARDGRIVEGTLLSADGAWLLVRADDGMLHDVSRSAVEDVRLETVSGDVLRPTLEVAVAGARTGRMDVGIDYLTGGMSWTAEHTLVRSGETGAEWGTAVHVVNHSGAAYADATLKLVAGDPRRVGGMPSPRPVRAAMEVSSLAMDAPKLSEESFGEYHLYSLEQPATLRDREAQRLTMYGERDIQVAPKYLYQGGGQGVTAQLVMRNEKGRGLGMALPAGRVRVFEPDASGALQFTGEAMIAHTPVDEEFTIGVGTAFDLVAERRIVRDQRVSNRERHTQVEIKLRNRKKASVTIHVEEPMGGDFEITSSSHSFERKDARTAKAAIQVPAGKEVVVTYEATIRY